MLEYLYSDNLGKITMSNTQIIDKINLVNVLLDSLPNPIYYKDKQGLFIECNLAFEELVKTKKENIIGKSAYEFFSKEVASRHKLIDKEIIESKGTHLDEIIFFTKDGKIKYFTLNKAVYLNTDKSVGGTLCIMHDITKKLKEKEILIQKSKLAEMGEIVASIAHQWNEPLVELSGQIQKLEYYYINSNIDNKKMSDFVNDSMIQVKYMSETLSDFRNFLKPCKKKSKFCIKMAIKEIFEIVGKQIFYFNIDVIFDYKKENLYIYAYKNEIKQVLLNIINNAKNKIINISEKCDFKGQIKIKAFENEKYTTIQISDNAGAIKDNVITHIFEPFFTTKDGGTGFGLYMAKEIIVSKHLGKINVKNDGNNVIFTIKIPKNEG